MASLKYFDGTQPGKKRKMSDAEKSEKKKEYEKRRKERQFNEKWISTRPWIVYDEKEKKMFCSVCKEFYKEDPQQQKSNAFIVGSDNFRASTVDDHQSSKAHSKAHEVLSNQARSIEEKMVSPAGRALAKLQASERACLHLLLRNAHAVAKNNRPLSDFTWLYKIDMAKKLDIGSTYLNDRAAASFVHSIAETERASTTKLLTECAFFAFMMDGSTDIAGDEQETVYIRTCAQGNVTEKFLDISSPNSTKSQDLYEHITEVFCKYQIDKEKLVAMGSDGASNMVGIRSGLSTLLKNNVNDEMVNIHCLCHRLELAFRDVIKPIEQYDKLMTLLIGLHYFYKKSYKNKQGLKKAIEAVGKGVFPPKVTGTRWLPHLLRAILALLKSYNALEAHLSTASHDTPKAEGLLKLMTNRQLMAFILFLKDALEPAMKLSLRLQKPRVLLADSLHWVESTMVLMSDKKDRTSTAVQLIIDTGEYSSIVLKGPPPSTVYQNKILQGFCDAIKERFQTEANNVLNATKILNFMNWPEPGSIDLKGFKPRGGTGVEYVPGFP